MKVEDFATNVKALYRALDSSITIGEDQSLTVEEVRGIVTKHISTAQNDDLEMLYYYIKEKQDCCIKKELDVLYTKWQAGKRTQLYMESLAKQILYNMRQTYGHNVSLLEAEYLIEEIFTYSTSMDELKGSYWDILVKFLQSDPLIDKIDTPQFLDKITDYLQLNLNQQLPLKELCVKFGVSQPYLSKMFRKYIDESYNHYMTRIRMEKARELMIQNTGVRVKDIAAMVGYDDQFYFSRIFRSYMDITPSEYIDNLRNREAL
jgi:two-component system response regulator YesN